MKKLLLVMALIAGFLSSCGDDEITLDPESVGTSYYPLELGTFKIFNVEETTYESNDVKGVITFQVKEVINQIYKDQRGKDWYRIEVSRRESPNGQWNIIGVKSINRELIDKKSGSQLIKYDNKTLVDLVFPIEEGKKWNAFAFTSDYDIFNVLQEYTYINVGKEYVTNGKVYDNTVTLKRIDNLTNLSNTVNFEILALNQGPIYREYIQLNFCNKDLEGCESNTIEDYIVFGIKRKETLESSGKIDL